MYFVPQYFVQSAWNSIHRKCLFVTRRLQNVRSLVSGAGGGWSWNSVFHPQDGASLLNGSQGGLPCPAAAEVGWDSHGGFGGGGGGCSAGGGGGGWTGKFIHVV